MMILSNEGGKWGAWEPEDLVWSNWLAWCRLVKFDDRAICIGFEIYF